MITNAKKEKLLKIRIAKERSIDRSMLRSFCFFVFTETKETKKVVFVYALSVP